MTKSKHQLRAEAVERLKMIHAHIGMSYNELLDALIPGYPRNSQTIQQAIIDLLTDEEPTNVITDGTNVTASDSPLGGKPPKGDATNEPHEGDAAYLLRKLSMDFKADVYKRDECEYIDSLADMVERDYVRREDYDAKCAEYSAMRDRAWGAEAERDEWKAVADALEATKRDWLDGYYLNKLTKAEADCDAFERIVDRLIAQRDKWKAKAEQAMESYQDAKADRDAWMAKAVRLDVDGEPCNQSYMDTDTEQQNPRSQEGESDKHVNSEGSKVTFAESRTFADMSEKDGSCVRDGGSASEIGSPRVGGYSAETAKAGCGLAQADTREKIDEELTDSCLTFAVGGGHLDAVSFVSGLLDRQADITERELFMEYCPECQAAQITELTVERDEWKAKYLGAVNDANDYKAKSKWPSNDGQVDSREKLEADVDRMVKEHGLYWLRTYIIEWLDRQADITHRETLCHPDERDEQIAELEAERNRLQGVVKAQADSFAKMERRLSELDSGSELNALRASVANLKASVVRQSAIIENQRGELARFNAEKRGTRRIPKGIKWPRYEDGRLVGINGAEASAITFEKGCYTIHHVGGTPEAQRGEYRDVPGPSPEAADTDAIEDDLLRFAKEWLEADGRVEEQRILRYYAREIGGAL